MLKNKKTVHTTLNLSAVLIHEAMRLFEGMNKTELIHKALSRLIHSEKLKRHALNWAGTGKITPHA